MRRPRHRPPRRRLRQEAGRLGRDLRHEISPAAGNRPAVTPHQRCSCRPRRHGLRGHVARTGQEQDSRSNVGIHSGPRLRRQGEGPSRTAPENVESAPEAETRRALARGLHHLPRRRRRRSTVARLPPAGLRRYRREIGSVVPRHERDGEADGPVRRGAAPRRHGPCAGGRLRWRTPHAERGDPAVRCQAVSNVECSRREGGREAKRLVNQEVPAASGPRRSADAGAVAVGLGQAAVAERSVVLPRRRVCRRRLEDARRLGRKVGTARCCAVRDGRAARSLSRNQLALLRARCRRAARHEGRRAAALVPLGADRQPPVTVCAPSWAIAVRPIGTTTAKRIR